LVLFLFRRQTGERFSSEKLPALDAGHRDREDDARKWTLKHDPEKWIPVFRKRSCSDKGIKREDESKKSHPL
jgi:hypothetical protein